MIQNALNRRPQISFGLGVLEKTISLGDTVTIWQNEIYNETDFGLFYDSIEKDLYSFDITPDSIGTFEIQCQIKNKPKLIFISSNKIILNVV